MEDYDQQMTNSYTHNSRPHTFARADLSQDYSHIDKGDNLSFNNEASDLMRNFAGSLAELGSQRFAQPPVRYHSETEKFDKEQVIRDFFLLFKYNQLIKEELEEMTLGI
mmetsp:Transcript_2449/g.4144  ORF Transcript_2449/g.4144 Transcript_2449/m.4144 type:complete len:109 (-) Transcript_2449:36-362(-)